MDRIRIATLQYLIRPVDSYDQFVDQVRGLVLTAADYGCRLLVFPEYFAIQLLCLADVDAPQTHQVRRLAARAPELVELMRSLAKEHGLYIQAGSFPVQDPDDPEVIYNDAHLFAPDGGVGVQGKLHMTRWEKEDWLVSPRNRLRVFETDIGTLAITICYDVEFPEIARTVAKLGADLLIVPSCTDDRQGFLRVRYCAQARCIENQIYVVCSSTVGSLPMVPSVALNYGQASVLTPCDFPFARDGILAEGLPNQETMVIAELNLETIHHNRTFGSVLPLNDSKHTAELVADPEVVRL